jgi:hypothetical protein
VLAAAAVLQAVGSKGPLMQNHASSILIALLGSTAACISSPDESTADSATSQDEALIGFREFTEGYGQGTLDVGHWALTTNDLRAREIAQTGGNPGGYLYGEVSSPIPTWSTASPRLVAATGIDVLLDSIFTGNYYADDIHRISADLCVYQAGSWSASRTVTLQLIRWDFVNDTIALDATYSPSGIPEVPAGWQHHAFEVDARSRTIPTGWLLTRGDGTPGTDADWAVLMHQIDVVSFGYWRPGYMYPALGLWELGIDNVHIGTR